MKTKTHLKAGGASLPNHNEMRVLPTSPRELRGAIAYSLLT